MYRASWFVPLVASILIALASAEIVFCSDCSPESCQFSHTSSHKGATSESGDDCLCCCAHLLVVSTAHVVPITLVKPAPAPPVPLLQFVPSPAVDHPPQL